MSDPDYSSPPFELTNYSHFGSELVLDYNTGVSNRGGTPDSQRNHSYLTKYFQIFNADTAFYITFEDNFPDDEIGSVTCYVEYMLEQGINYDFPDDYMRMKIVIEKRSLGVISTYNPLHISVSIESKTNGVEYTEPEYEYPYDLDTYLITASITSYQREGNTLDFDFYYFHSFFKTISEDVLNYPINLTFFNLWRVHRRLNIEANTAFAQIIYEEYLDSKVVAYPNSIESEEAFGAFGLTITGNQTITLISGIPTEETFGNPFIVVDAQILVPTGIASLEAFGAPTITRTTTIESALPEPELPKEGDIRLELNPYIGYGEMIIDDRDVERDSGLETSVLVTLGSNRIANQDDVLPDDQDHGGWWADVIPDTEGDLIGTRLWLLRRAKTNNELITKSQEYIKEGFQWMLDDGVISNLIVETWIAERNTLGMIIGLQRPGFVTVFYKYYYNWINQALRGVE